MVNLDTLENIPSSIERSSETFMPPNPYGRAALARANKTQRTTTKSGTENESSDDEVADDEEEEESDHDNEDEDDEDDDDGDDESDQPVPFTVPRAQRKSALRTAGQLAEYRRMFHSEDPVLYEDPHELLEDLSKMTMMMTSIGQSMTFQTRTSKMMKCSNSMVPMPEQVFSQSIQALLSPFQTLSMRRTSFLIRLTASQPMGLAIM